MIWICFSNVAFCLLIYDYTSDLLGEHFEATTFYPKGPKAKNRAELEFYF